MLAVAAGLYLPQADSSTSLRTKVWHSDPCLAWIVDHENRSWNPTISYGGGHNVYSSYGLPQANPGTKMRSAGRDWATNPVTQLRWMKGYVNGRYGSSCNAKSYWQRHYAY